MGIKDPQWRVWGWGKEILPGWEWAGNSGSLFEGIRQEGGSTLHGVGTVNSPWGGSLISPSCPLHGGSTVPTLWNVLFSLPYPLKGGLLVSLPIHHHGRSPISPPFTPHEGSSDPTPWRRMLPSPCPVPQKKVPCPCPLLSMEGVSAPCLSPSTEIPCSYFHDP